MNGKPDGLFSVIHLVVVGAWTWTSSSYCYVLALPMALGGLPDGTLPDLACSGGSTESYNYILSWLRILWGEGRTENRTWLLVFHELFSRIFLLVPIIIIVYCCWAERCLKDPTPVKAQMLSPPRTTCTSCASTQGPWNRQPPCVCGQDSIWPHMVYC